MKEKFKNLYNKKPIKITFRILTVLVYLFTIIMILLLCLGSCSYDHKDNNIINKEKSINCVAKRDNIYMFGYNEIASREALDSVIFWANNINTYYSGFASCDNSFRYYNLLQDSPLSPSTNNMNNTFLISQVGSSGAPTTIFNARKITFYSTVINAQNWRRWYYYISFGNDGNNEAYNIEYNLFTDITNTTNVNETYSTLFTVTIKHTVNGSTYTDIDSTDYAYSFYENSTCYLMFSQLVNKQLTEYQNGFQYGYNEGYQNGFEAGQNDLSINGASPFLLLKQGADAIASLLDIKILPFLSLGTLMFTPIVIALIIVIVKMVKG